MSIRKFSLSLLVSSALVLGAATPFTAGATSPANVIVLFSNVLPPDLASVVASNGGTLLKQDANLAYAYVNASDPNAFMTSMSARSDVQTAYVGSIGTLSGVNFCVL